MSIELAIQENTKAVRELIDTIRYARNPDNITPAEAREVMQPEVPVVPAAPAAPAASNPIVTKEELNKALLGYMKSNGREGAAKLLAKFGAKTAGDLKEEQRVEFIRAIESGDHAE